MYIFKMDEMSLDDWIGICEFQPPKEYTKLDIENGYLIISNDDLVKLNNYLFGERDIPDLKMSEEILGDIETGDLSCEEWTYGDFGDVAVEDFHGIVDTRGVWNYHSAKLVIENTKKYEEYSAVSFTGRKGYPSIIWGKN